MVTYGKPIGGWAALFAAMALSTPAWAQTSADEARAVADVPPPGPAAGDPVAPADSRAPPSPRLHHAPVATAVPHEPLTVDATIDYPQLVKYAGLVYRGPTQTMRSVPFQRGAGMTYVAVIPESDVQAPGLSYAIELERVDGSRTSAFASREAMQPVEVAEDRMDATERSLYERLGKRRSVATVSSDFVRFGRTSGSHAIPCAPEGEGCTPGQSVVPRDVDDQYYRIEAGYTYRPLRTVAEFSIRGGVVRGRSLVPLKAYDERKYDVGLNYGSPSVRFRLADAWHLEWEILTSVTEIGFSVGTGGALLIGDPYGSRLTAGFETIGLTEGTYFGSRLYTRMDVVATERLTVAPIVEVTDMPHAETFGVRLLAEATAALGGGFSVAVRGGYQARKSTSGGPGFGGNLSLAF